MQVFFKMPIWRNRFFSLLNRICDIVLIAFCGLSLWSCQVENKPAKHKLITFFIDPNKIINTDSLSRLIEVNDVVKLETNDTILIGRIAKVEYNNGKYFVLDNVGSKRLFVFDSQGKILSSIGRIGKGPGEYSVPNDFSINRSNDEIYILNTPGKLVNVYDVSGRFKRNFTLDFYAVNLEISNNGVIVFAGLDKDLLYLTNLNGKIIKKAFDNNYFNPLPNPLSHDNDRIYLTTFLKDTVYQIDGETIKPFLILDFGAKALTEKKYLAIEPSIAANGMKMRRVGNNYFFNLSRFVKVKEGAVFFFDSGQGGVINFANLSNGKVKSVLAKNIFDDLFGGGFIYSSYTYNDKYFIGIIEPSKIKRGTIFFGGNEIIANANDNPYLALYEIK